MLMQMQDVPGISFPWSYCSKDQTCFPLHREDCRYMAVNDRGPLISGDSRRICRYKSDVRVLAKLANRAFPGNNP